MKEKDLSERLSNFAAGIIGFIVILNKIIQVFILNFTLCNFHFSLSAQNSAEF